MTNNRWQGLGVTRAELEPGRAVMVASGTVAAQVNGGPAIICYAEVIGPADESSASVMIDPSDVWWLAVFTGAGEPLPQMYRADEILGIPAIGLVARA